MALPRTQQHLGDRPTREVIDTDRRSWVLGEVPSVGLDGIVQNALVAEDGDLIRRFKNFPENWAELSDQALISLVHACPRPAGASSRDTESQESASTDCRKGR
ncbi:MAG: hypothetical protein M3Z30_07910 [Gemmatimonadota bacterium]|nr:hypothetical protein [Gemmatimonadota bacterium]